jgi:hypothetical protein
MGQVPAEMPDGYRGRRRRFRSPFTRKAGGAAVPVLLIVASLVVVLVVVGVSQLLPKRSDGQSPSGAPTASAFADTSQAPAPVDGTTAPSGTVAASTTPGKSPGPKQSSAVPGSGTPGPTPTPTPTPTSTPPGGGGSAITNGGFETGGFAGWSRSGTTSLVTSPVHSGGHAALLGSNSPTAGDSTVSLTFTAPAGTGTVSFWYNVNCPDEVFWDWAMASLKDNTTRTVNTVLPKTCTRGAGWRKVSAAITPGHSYTLTLVSHDENNPGDATSTAYDDITVS